MTERWHLNGFNLFEVIVIRDGPDPQGRRYVDGRHQISIAKFNTIEQARECCDRHNKGLSVSQDDLDRMTIDEIADAVEASLGLAPAIRR